MEWGDGGHLGVSGAGRAGHVQIGIHDFLNGSGHLVDMAAPELVVPMTPGSFIANGTRFSFGVDRVYGFVKSALQAKVEERGAPADILLPESAPKR